MGQLTRSGLTSLGEGMISRGTRRVFTKELESGREDSSKKKQHVQRPGAGNMAPAEEQVHAGGTWHQMRLETGNRQVLQGLEGQGGTCVGP